MTSLPSMPHFGDSVGAAKATIATTQRRATLAAISDSSGGGSGSGESDGALQLDDDRSGLLIGAVAADGPGATVATASYSRPTTNPLSISYVTAVFVLALLCLVLGLVYGYLHFTKGNSRWSRRLFGSGGGSASGIGAHHHGGGGSGPGGLGGAGDAAHGSRSTHIFLIRSSGSGGGGNPKSIQSL